MQGWVLGSFQGLEPFDKPSGEPLIPWAWASRSQCRPWNTKPYLPNRAVFLLGHLRSFCSRNFCRFPKGTRPELSGRILFPLQP